MNESVTHPAWCEESCDITAPGGAHNGLAMTIASGDSEFIVGLTQRADETEPMVTVTEWPHEQNRPGAETRLTVSAANDLAVCIAATLTGLVSEQLGRTVNEMTYMIEAARAFLDDVKPDA